MIPTGADKWHYGICLGNYTSAVLFAKGLARQFGEIAFFDRTKGELQIVTPKEG